MCLDDYVDLLKTNELKITHHRLAILKYLDNHRTHPTAEEIYQHLKKTNPGLSRTTVYNNLETLSDSHIIQRLTICPTEHRYDFNNSMHHHFICTECGSIIDIDFECPTVSKIKKHVTEQGHQIEEVHGYFKGICKTCLEKKGREHSG
jgi:Fe2+ or Zn2+ uptake regulation protein